MKAEAARSTARRSLADPKEIRELRSTPENSRKRLDPALGTLEKWPG
jgi:hypothetical protein